MKSCEQYELLASLTIDGEASPEEQNRLMEHLELCPECRAYFEDIKRIHETFAREEIVLPEDFAVRVMDRVRETKQERPANKKKTVRFPHWQRCAALAACCAVAVLSAWGFLGNRGVKLTANMNDAAVDMRSMNQDAAVQGADIAAAEDAAGTEDAGLENEIPDEAPPPVPEEYLALAESAAKTGAGEGDYQPLADEPSPPEAVLAASPPPADDAVDSADSDVSPEPGSYERDQGSEEESKKQDEMGSAENKDSELPEDSVMPSVSLVPPAPDEELNSPAEPVPMPEENSTEIEPVEVIGVPEPGILTAYGSAARAWVENVLGLEWAGGGSYPLTAEQYSDLLRTLEDAGEPYRIEPGDGYCLMTE